MFSGDKLNFEYRSRDFNICRTLLIIAAGVLLYLNNYVAWKIRNIIVYYVQEKVDQNG